jgi:penicillin amidase
MSMGTRTTTIMSMTMGMRTRTEEKGKGQRGKGRPCPLLLSPFPFALLLFVLSALPLLAQLPQGTTVKRDARGLPYIKAANEHDLFFAQGYVTAADRLFQMELLRRTVRGELAEILGKDLVEEDRRRRIYGFGRLADAAVSLQAPDYGAALAAYAEGVNAWVAEHKDGLPVEFAKLKIEWRPWKPADTLLIGYLFAEDLSTTWPTDLAVAGFTDLPKETFTYFFPSITPNDLYLVGDGKAPKERPPGGVVISSATPSFVDLEDRREASNNFVIAGSRTATGKPMLANDPHLAASAPSIWHMVTLECPTIHVAGVTTPGVPGVLLGHNDRIAWGCTNVAPDVQDLYRETFDGTKYKTPAGWEEATVRKETINVRGGDPVTVDVVVTRHGPVVAESYALQWPVLDPQRGGTFDAFYRINRARNWGELQAALRRYTGATQNFVYADVDGNIGWYAAGRIPIRSKGDGMLPLDGATDADGAWTKFIPFEELPHLYNPESGIIVTANQRIAGPSYRYALGTAWTTPYRARRIQQLLTAKKGKLTLDDLRAVQGDTYAWSDALFATEVAKMAKGKTEPEWQELAKAFGQWNGMGRTESTALPLAMAMREAFRKRVLAAALGPERFRRYRWPGSNAVIDRIVSERPAAYLPKDMASWEALMLASYAEAKQDLGKMAGPDPAKWALGALRHYRFPHPLARSEKVFEIEVPATSGGSSNPVNAAAGVSMRFLADLANWDRSRLGITLGESGDPASPHWKDQLDDWLKVQPGVFVFSMP